MAVRGAGRGPRRRVAASLAAGAPASVFVAAGPGARDRAEDLALRPEVRVVRSPRHASILLVAGTIPDACDEALARLHDQLPHPRATLAWGGRAPPAGGTGPAGGWLERGSRAGSTGTAPGVGAPDAGGPEVVPAASDPVPALRALYRDLLDGRRPSEPPVLPDEPPRPWRGVGPYGRGARG